MVYFENSHSKKKALRGWEKSKEKIALSCLKNSNKLTWKNIKKGSVYMCVLGENIGEETNKTRPVVVISSRRNNRMGHVLIAPLTSTIIYKNPDKPERGLKYPTNYLLKIGNYPFLKNDSVVKLDQMRTVSKARFLEEPLGELKDGDIRNINKKIKNYLDL